MLLEQYKMRMCLAKYIISCSEGSKGKNIVKNPRMLLIFKVAKHGMCLAQLSNNLLVRV